MTEGTWVSERLPLDGEPVIAYGAKRLQWAIMRYSHIEESWEVESCSEFHPSYPPKFWMSLPEPPEPQHLTKTNQESK